MKISAQLRLGACSAAVGIALVATPSFAQATGGSAQDTAGSADQGEDATDDDTPVIVVTGSILNRENIITASPVTVISAVTLEERGLNTASDAVQRLSANNAGTIAAGWNTGFNFASGATAPALRGLTVQSTLSISDGLRIAPYPLADDGQRNFVDLNTIPNAIVERIEVLRDGASSTYGADAIAGVVNIITKKEIQGLHLDASFGVSEEGDADEQRFSATWGYGDLDDQGFNFYISAEYQNNEELFARDRGFPFNTQDWSSICGDSGSCLLNHNWNSVTTELGDTRASFNGFVDIPGVALARPVTTPGGATGDGTYQFLNPAAGCREWDPVTITANQAGTTGSPLNTCEVDFQNAYVMLQPDIERKGLSGRLTANVGDNAQFYAMGNYYETETFASLTPLSFRGRPTNPIPAGLATYNVIAPVYVCAAGAGTLNGLNTGCDATNGVLNPYNPFAAAGQTAQISFRSPRGRTVETKSRALRGVLGIDGTFGDDWKYSANFSASEIRLTRIQNNYLIPQRIADVLAQGTFNFFDPSQTSEDVWDYIAPENRTVSTSKLWQAQGTLAKDLFELPGGMLQAAVGASYREESIDAPSGNPGLTNPTANQYDRYYSVNAVGTAGSRNVSSAFFEINAPVIDRLELSLSGRYDDYSTGQSNFSPKFGAKFAPVDMLTIRGTYSEGFRIPSFNEAFGLPTTGFVSRTVNCVDFAAYCAAHGNNAYATNSYSLGLTQTGNPELEPEKSKSYTLGLIFDPVSNIRVTIDYWNIKVDGLISGVTSTAQAEIQYYSNNGVVNIPGITVIPGLPDPGFPNALPQIGFIQSSFANQDSQTVTGLDFAVNGTFDVTETIKLRSNFDASYLIKYELRPADGSDPLRYEDTLSPCNITSCSGSPEWRGAWQNSLDFGDTVISLTAYYTKGTDTASLDFGGIRGDCEFNAANATSTVTFVDGSPYQCRTKDIWNVDLTASHKINDKFTIYGNVLNVFGIDAPFDPAAAYNLFGFNPAFAGPNVLGRYFKVGAKVDF